MHIYIYERKTLILTLIIKFDYNFSYLGILFLHFTNIWNIQIMDG